MASSTRTKRPKNGSSTNSVKSTSTNGSQTNGRSEGESAPGRSWEKKRSGGGRRDGVWAEDQVQQAPGFESNPEPRSVGVYADENDAEGNRPVDDGELIPDDSNAEFEDAVKPRGKGSSKRR